MVPTLQGVVEKKCPNLSTLKRKDAGTGSGSNMTLQYAGSIHLSFHQHAPSDTSPSSHAPHLAAGPKTRAVASPPDLPGQRRDCGEGANGRNRPCSFCACEVHAAHPFQLELDISTNTSPTQIGSNSVRWNTLGAQHILSAH